MQARAIGVSPGGTDRRWAPTGGATWKRGSIVTCSVGKAGGGGGGGPLARGGAGAAGAAPPPALPLAAPLVLLPTVG